MDHVHDKREPANTANIPRNDDLPAIIHVCPRRFQRKKRQKVCFRVLQQRE